MFRAPGLGNMTRMHMLDPDSCMLHASYRLSISGEHNFKDATRLGAGFVHMNDMAVSGSRGQKTRYSTAVDICPRDSAASAYMRALGGVAHAQQTP